jgi:hypothetical protein
MVHGNIARPHGSSARGRPSTGRRVMEWLIVLGLVAGATVVLFLTLSQGPDPKKQAEALVAQMRDAIAGRPVGPSLFGSFPMVARGQKEIAVTVTKVPPKVCVSAAWQLYRTGAIAVNGVTPTRVSAAKLVELCNENEVAAITWVVKATD